jgi:hypothetical protein
MHPQELHPEPTNDQENIMAPIEKPASSGFQVPTQIGVTRKSHEETKKRRKMARASRKINRRK